MNRKEENINDTNVTRNRQKEVFLLSLERGSSITDSCEAAKISRMTVWRWRKKYKGFDNKVLLVIDSRTQTVEDALFATALKGNVIAQIFWLKNRAKDRWKDKFEQKVELEEVGELADAKEKLISKINSIIAREKKTKGLRRNKKSK